MAAEPHKKRRMDLLKKLAERAGGRHDMKLLLSEVAPELDIQGFAGGSRFVDKANPAYEGGSELTFDFNTLREEGLIEMAYLDYHQDSLGDVIYTNPGVKVTPMGLEAVSEARKWWVQKAIDKEPVTAVQGIVALAAFVGGCVGTWAIGGHASHSQLAVTILIAVGAAAGGWAIGRYITPACKPSPAPQSANSGDGANPTRAGSS